MKFDFDEFLEGLTVFLLIIILVVALGIMVREMILL